MLRVACPVQSKSQRATVTLSGLRRPWPVKTANVVFPCSLGDDPIRTRKNCDDAENLQIGVEVWFTFPRNSELFQSVNDAIQPEKRSRNSELGYMILMRTRALNAQ